MLHAMRRWPKNRYQSADELLADLDRLGDLDPAGFDLSPEPAMGGASGADSPAALWLRIALIALGFCRPSPRRRDCAGGEPMSTFDLSGTSWVRLSFVDVFGTAHSMQIRRRASLTPPSVECRSTAPRLKVGRA